MSRTLPYLPDILGLFLGHNNTWRVSGIKGVIFDPHVQNQRDSAALYGQF